MAINRFDTRPNNYDYSMVRAVEQLPQLDWNALDAIVGDVQNKLDQSSLISKKIPQYLNTKEDNRLLQEYLNTVNTGLSDITGAYSKSIREGRSKQNEYLRQIQDEWLPGGKADLLQRRYNNYKEKQTELEKFYKDDKRNVNKTLAQNQLLQDLNSPINYNPLTRQGKTDFNADFVNDPDLRDSIDKMLKEIEADGDTRFLGDFNKDYWIQKIKTEQRSEGKIQAAFEALASQPEYQSQLQRDTQYQLLNTDPDLYQKEFTQGLDQQTSGLEQLYKEAQTDKQKAKEWQETLRQNGYDVSVDGVVGDKTKQASDQFLNKLKQQTQNKKNNFNLEENVYNDVTNSYLDYALRGAYRKVDKDLIYNKAIMDRLDLAEKRRANDINQQRLEYEFADTKNSDVFVGTGKVQALPDFLNYVNEIKTEAGNAETRFTKALKGSIFNGWKPENIAEAYNLFEQSNGDKTQFENLLRQNSDYKFSKEQIDGLYTEMMLPESESGIKTLMDTYHNTKEEARALDQSFNQISNQYIQTPEGKQNLNRLRKELPQYNNLSDQELVNAVTANESQFGSNINVPVTVGSAFGAGSSFNYKSNPASMFKEQMVKDVKKQEKQGINYDWNNLATFEVYAGKSDKTLRPVLDNLTAFIKNSDGTNISSFGSIGLKLRNAEGDEVKGDNIDIDNYAVGKNAKGEPVIKMSGTATKDGKKGEKFFTEVSLVKGSPESQQVLTGLERAYVSKYKNGEAKEAEAILNIVRSLEGDTGIKNAGRDVVLNKLSPSNTQRQPVLFEQNGKVINSEDIGWKYTRIGTPKRVAGMDFTQVGILTPDGQKKTGLVGTNGENMFLIPNDKGSFIFNNTFDVDHLLKQKEILSKHPVEVTKTKN